MGDVVSLAEARKKRAGGHRPGRAGGLRVSEEVQEEEDIGERLAVMGEAIEDLSKSGFHVVAVVHRDGDSWPMASQEIPESVLRSMLGVIRAVAARMFLCWFRKR